MAAPWEDNVKTFAQHHILLMFAFSLLVSIGVLVYLYTDLQQYKDQTDQRLSQTEAELDSKMALLQNETKATNEALQYRLEAKDQVFEQALKSIRDEYHTRMQTLLKLVDEIEKTSKVKMDELKKQLSDKNPGDLSEEIDTALDSIVSVTTDAALGSGALVSKNGDIVTNNHVVDGARSISITLRSGKVLPAQLIYKTAEYDIAFLRIAGDSYPFLEFADSDLLKPGEKVVALGNPAGLQFSASEGIVSATHRSIASFNDVIQIDVSINQGSSGGPLINKYGRIIGITSFKIKGSDDLGFAIPSNAVKRLLERFVG